MGMDCWRPFHCLSEFKSFVQQAHYLIEQASISYARDMGIVRREHDPQTTHYVLFPGSEESIGSVLDEL